MKKLIFPILATLLLSSTVLAQRETRFFTSFEYGSLDDEPLSPVSPSELDGADGQVGTWDGTDVPEASGGDILEQPDPMGFRNNPYDGGRLLVLDRPGGDPEIGDFKGSINAVLSEPVTLLGAEISFEMGTRRTGGNHNKDYDIVGRDADGAESFRLRVGTNNNGGERLGYVIDDGATVVFDLPTVVGEDRPADMNNTGYNAGLPGLYEDSLGGPGALAEFPLIKLSMGQDGWVINLAHQEQNTSGEANAYTTAALPYSGSASELASVEFGYSGAGGTGVNSGWFLDNIQVTGFDEFLQGDFDLDGEIGFGDFLILSNNFGEETSDGDYDFNGIVNLADFAKLRSAMEAAAAPAGAAAVPEPSSLSLLAIGFLGFLARRRRR